ncbi:membrane fusion protein, multidrug efflux system [Gammaproteobacteria bacterium]
MTEEHPKPKKKWKKVIFWVTFSSATLGSSAYYYYYYYKAPKVLPPPQTRSLVPSVTVGTATQSDVPIYFDGLGTVTAFNTVTLHARVDGQLTKVLFQEGQKVKSGEVLAEIDAKPFQIQLEQAEGQLARDQALLRNAETDLSRYRSLFKENTLARQSLDTQEALVRQYQGTIKVDQAQIDQTRLQLSYCQVTSPLAGRIGLRHMDPGNLIRTTDGLAVITQIQPVSVLFAFPEARLPTLVRSFRAANQSNPLKVEAWNRDLSEKLAEGFLSALDNQIDVTTGTLKLKAQFSNQGETLFPNQFIIARLQMEVQHRVTVVPTAAIQRGTKGTFVFLLKKDQKVIVQPIRLGYPVGNQTIVEEGLKIGDQVVLDGVDKLKEGTKVNVVVTRN